MKWVFGEMKAFLVISFFILLFMALIGGVVWWKIYAFHDCRNVGHALLYCIISIGR